MVGLLAKSHKDSNSASLSNQLLEWLTPLFALVSLQEKFRNLSWNCAIYFPETISINFYRWTEVKTNCKKSVDFALHAFTSLYLKGSSFRWVNYKYI